jgi:hypothetical protein
MSARRKHVGEGYPWVYLDQCRSTQILTRNVKCEIWWKKKRDGGREGCVRPRPIGGKKEKEGVGKN